MNNYKITQSKRRRELASASEEIEKYHDYKFSLGHDPMKSLHVDMQYPKRDEGQIGDLEVTVGLCDVRAASDIHIKYDFDRDGYVIYNELPTKPVFVDSPSGGYWDCTGFELLESAFVPAWHPNYKTSDEWFEEMENNDQ